MQWCDYGWWVGRNGKWGGHFLLERISMVGVEDKHENAVRIADSQPGIRKADLQKASPTLCRSGVLLWVRALNHHGQISRPESSIFCMHPPHICWNLNLIPTTRLSWQCFGRISSIILTFNFIASNKSIDTVSNFKNFERQYKFGMISIIKLRRNYITICLQPTQVRIFVQIYY
jgi:hypothetical protein